MTDVKQILDAKREGREIPADDIRALVAGYAAGDVPDYQMSAFAMAVCCRGMSDGEIFALTDAMRLSGANLDWKGLGRPSADKHSTGGVGDKLSLVIMPVAAACGLAVPSIAGRGLGHTGGTIDKLESIPGYATAQDAAAFRGIVAECGASIVSQSPEICPADRKLYALRDVTGTVPSIPLIVASILSKKLAGGAETLVFDVKCGCGAFMRTPDGARALAEALVNGARAAGRKTAALVTDMNAPLGRMTGNALEVAEALEALDGADVPDVTSLSLEFAALMVSLAKDVPLDEARRECAGRLADGSAKRVFERMVELHGGDLAAFRDIMAAGSAASMTVARGNGGGEFVSSVDALAVARAAAALGAGRSKLEDSIDPLAGVELLARRGDRVAPGEPVARVYSAARPERLAEAADMVRGAFSFSQTPPPPGGSIIARIPENMA